MATAAQRAQKKDLGPDWRETLAASIRGFVRKTIGVALIGLSVALGVALVTHSSVDPSLSDRRRRPADQLARRVRRLFQRCRCCSCSGRPSALFLPLVALIGLRMVRGVDTGPHAARAAGRGDRRRADRHRARPLRRLRRFGPARPAMAGRSAWPAPMASMPAVELIGNPVDRRAAAPVPDGDPAHWPASSSAGSRSASGLKRSSGQPTGLRRDPAAPAPRPRRSREERWPTTRMASQRRRARVRRSRSPIRPGRSRRRQGATEDGQGSLPGRPASRSATITSCRRSTCSPPPPEKPQEPDRPRRPGAQRPPARKRARGFPRPRRHRRGPARPGRHHVRAGAGQRDQGQPGHPAGRRHRAQHVGAVGARRHHPRPKRDRHRAAQPEARDGVP